MTENDPLDNKNIDNPGETNPTPESTHRSQADPGEHYDTHPADRDIPWLEQHDVDELHSRWTTIQAQFVDQPCTAIEQGDALVAEAIEKLQSMLTDHHNMLRDRWLNRDDASTEELRKTLQDYRSFLNHLLDK